MKVLENKRILFLSPSFFKYETMIKNKMEEMGAVVDYYDERSIRNSFSKALLKINPNIFYFKSIKYYKKILNDNKNNKYDYILIIKCDMIPTKILKIMKQTYPNAKLVLYLWDSIRNMPGILSKIEYFDYCKSFDLSDSKKYDFLSFRPLFYGDEYKKELKKNKSYKYDISFLGTIHSDRYKIIKELESIANKNNLKSYWFKYLQSNFIYYFYKLTKKEYKNTKIQDFDFKKMNAKEISRIVDESKCILDIQHPRQTGLTMRTIEMIGMNKKIITTNSNIKNYDFYNKNNIYIIDRNNLKLDLDFLRTDYKFLKKDIYNKYSLEYWIKDVFDINK